MLQPSYSAAADRALDQLEADDSATELYNAVVAKLHLICEHPDSDKARQRQIRSSGGEVFWLVIVRVPQEKDDWGIFWAPDGDEAVFAYIGPWPPVH